MKTINKIGVGAILAITLLTCTNATAQEYQPYYINADWQFNAPLTSDFTKRASGWGMNFEGGYYVTPNIGLGAFLAFSTNHKQVATNTISLSSTSALTTNQARSMFQLPFGVSARYRFLPESGIFDPYAGFKMGAEYAKLSSYVSTYKIYTDTWGFYMSPEIGTNVWFGPNKEVGAHIALYYSFSTNKGHVLDGSVDKINNIGFRLGLAF